jgi:hypothetical protein
MCPLLCGEDGTTESGAGAVFPLAADRVLRSFEGLDSERGIAWRSADSLALRSFLGVGLNDMAPDHSTLSRTRRLIDVETHQAVFRWVLELLAEKDLLKGKTIGIDATTLEANPSGSKPSPAGGIGGECL